MKETKTFWIIWIFFAIGVICFYHVIGMFSNIDIGKSVILTLSILLPAIPIYYFLKSNNKNKH